MRVMDFYSARLLFIILIAAGPGRRRNHYDDSVIVFRAKDYDHAFERALELGRKRESDYKNDDGQRVRWLLVKIWNLDRIGPKVDGKEVASYLHYHTSKKPIPPERIFHPEQSKPKGSFCTHSPRHLTSRCSERRDGVCLCGCVLLRRRSA